MRARRSRSRKPRARAARLSPEARRAQLLEHALAVFARRGLGVARHAEIAQDAGVSVAATFVYFPTRARLVAAVLDAVEGFYLEQATAVHARRDVPAPRALLDHARAFDASVTTHPHHARVWLDWSTSFRDDVWPRYVAFHERIVRLVEGTMRRGQREGTIDPEIDPEDEARLMFGAAHMVAHLHFTGASRQRVARFLRSLVRSVGGRIG